MSDEMKTLFPHARPPNLWNREEDVVLTQTQLDALQKEFDDRNRKHPPTTLSFDPLLALPTKSEEELKQEADALADEQLKLIEMLSRIPEEENADA